MPHDDGLLGQTALRALTGELPHRDFADPYTGGLDYWNALAFVLFGINLLAPRILLYASFLAFLGAAYGIARRFLPDVGAGVALVALSVWSLPNYPVAMPTWYNLFLAVGALWCFVCFTEERRSGWLVTAGAACGLSLLVKSVGLYAVAAILMAIALQEVDDTALDSDAPNPHGGDRSDTGYRVVIVGGMIAYAALVVLLVRARLATAEVVHFVLPSVLAAGLVAWRCGTAPSRVTSAVRLGRLIRMAAPFAGGVLAPIALFAVPYVLSGSLGSLAEGVLVLPFRRLSFAAASPLPLSLFLPGLPVLGLATAACILRGSARVAALVVLGALLAAIGYAGDRNAVYQGVWGAAMLSPAAAVLAGVVAVGRAPRAGRGSRAPAIGGAVVAMLATFTLVQYPFAGPVYSFYVAPLVVLVGTVVVGMSDGRLRTPATLLVLFAIAFGLRWVATASLVATAQGRYETRADTVRLTIPRGKIRVSAADRSLYEDLVDALRRTTESGAIYATPDTPETYFLSGFRNPTHTLYEFLDDPPAASVIRALEGADVGVVVLNRAPQFSRPPPPDLLRAIESRYPNAQVIGRFIIRWR